MMDEVTRGRIRVTLTEVADAQADGENGEQIVYERLIAPLMQQLLHAAKRIMDLQRQRNDLRDACEKMKSAMYSGDNRLAALEAIESAISETKDQEP